MTIWVHSGVGAWKCTFSTVPQFRKQLCLLSPVPAHRSYVHLTRPQTGCLLYCGWPWRPGCWLGVQLSSWCQATDVKGLSLHLSGSSHSCLRADGSSACSVGLVAVPQISSPLRTIGRMLNWALQQLTHVRCAVGRGAPCRELGLQEAWAGSLSVASWLDNHQSVNVCQYWTKPSKVRHAANRDCLEYAAWSSPGRGLRPSPEDTGFLAANRPPCPRSRVQPLTPQSPYFCHSPRETWVTPSVPIPHFLLGSPLTFLSAFWLTDQCFLIPKSVVSLGPWNTFFSKFRVLVHWILTIQIWFSFTCDAQ